MHKFDAGDLDVLVSSTIIANGIDLPNANTLIVTQATYLGLSDLYQLRGRVGRRDRQGHAYFVYNQEELTGLQRKRLTALTEASRLGSGWSLAQRDLEIRGAGNLLGSEQSGTVNVIGVQLYLDMVQEAMHQGSEPLVRRHDVDVRLPLVATIPSHYIADPTIRTSTYQQLGRARSVAELEQQFETIEKQYGPAPTEVTNVTLLLRLQHAAATAGVTTVESITISPSDEDPYERIILETKHVQNVLGRVTPMGNWEFRDEKLQLDVTAITPRLVETLVEQLSLAVNPAPLV